MPPFRQLVLGLGLCLFQSESVLADARDKTLDIVAPFEIGGVDPSIAGTVFQRMNVAETLVGIDDQGAAVPALAERWNVSEDGLRWRFSLRPGVHFHDGTALTADSVVNALRVAAGKPGILDKAPLSTIESEGGDVLITLDRPFAPLPSFLAQYSTMILAPAAYGDDGQVKAVIGTGPYRITSLQAPQRLAVERFDRYWGTAPAIERATYLAAGRGETRALMAESGDADFVFNLDPASRTRLTRGARVEVLSVAIPRSILLKVNAADGQLDDVRARRALSLAIDREGIAAAILRYPAAADQLFPPSVGQWHDAGLAPLKYDPEQARQLLSSIGWKAGDDGMLMRDGKPFSLTLITYPDRPELPLVAAVLQQQFRDIGVALTINATNSSEIPARHQDGTLQLGLMARNFALVPDPIGTMLQDYGPQGSDWGAMNWSNSRFNDAIEALASGRDPGNAQAQRDHAVAILQEELPVIPIAWYQQTAAVSRQLQNPYLDPYERDFGIARMRWAE